MKGLRSLGAEDAHYFPIHPADKSIALTAERYTSRTVHPAMQNAKINVALADDHILVRNGLSRLIRSFDGYKVLFEASDGKDFLDKLDAKLLPDIALMDVNMPEMNGYETTLWLKKKYPQIKVLALSMYNDEQAIFRMLTCGARGYLLKAVEPQEFRKALDLIVEKGFYCCNQRGGQMVRGMGSNRELPCSSQAMISLKTREIEFLKWAATELTYKDIADKMCRSTRTIDGYRDDLFLKLSVRSRVGLAMFAVRHGYVSP
jgi:two-component system invasion response regulator UvrY